MTRLLSASDLAAGLAGQAEAVCRTYLPGGRKQGRYWLIGDVLGTPGRSLYVRLTGPEAGKGAAGNWADAATGQYGDLLDLLRFNRGLPSTREAMAEARAFLSLPQPTLPSPAPNGKTQRTRGTAEAARRLFARAYPIARTAADLYLRHRGLDASVGGSAALRFHPSCFYRDADHAPTRTFPALIARVTDGEGRITGVHRTWLDPADPRRKAPVASPRRAMGDLLGHGVRFGVDPCPAPVLVAGEGLETILSLRMVMPRLPATLGRLYVAVDGDRAGRGGQARLSERARQAGIEVLALTPCLGDFNEDLWRLGRHALAKHLGEQLVLHDAARFLMDGATP